MMVRKTICICFLTSRLPSKSKVRQISQGLKSPGKYFCSSFADFRVCFFDQEFFVAEFASLISSLWNVSKGVVESVVVRRKMVHEPLKNKKEDHMGVSPGNDPLNVRRLKS